MTLQPVIEPVDVELIEAELTPERFLRRTNKAGNEIYTFTAHEAPNAMREVGRLRELAFRAPGGGTGLDCDIDEFDTMPNPCRQLIVWNPETREIIGGYRYILGSDVEILPDGSPRIATGHLFDFSDKFIKELLPSTLELGRSFVRLEYQSTRAGAKAIFALDNLWDGLGALTVVHPEIKYLFGKVTMYPSYNREARDMILYFMNKHFPDRENLITPKTPLVVEKALNRFEPLFVHDAYTEDYRILNKEIRALGVNIPPLVNAYMSLSPSMRTFGTAINDEFGDVEETGIFMAVAEIHDEKKVRHIQSYIDQLEN